MSVNPYRIVEMFEETLAEYTGAKYAVCVESCTAAIFLSLMYYKQKGMFHLVDNKIDCPKLTYPSVPCSIIHAGYKVNFIDLEWDGQYRLSPLNIWDAALRFKKGMYHKGFGFQCISMHVKKHLKIGRGGAILTDDFEAVQWFRKARFDGRNPVPLLEDNFDMLGWNVYMNPPDAARGLQLMQALGDTVLEDLKVEDQKYNDLSKFPVYQQ